MAITVALDDAAGDEDCSLLAGAGAERVFAVDAVPVSFVAAVVAVVDVAILAVAFGLEALCSCSSLAAAAASFLGSTVTSLPDS